MPEPDVPESVVVQVVDVDQGREITWGSSVVEKLRDRVGDIQNAIVAAAQAIDLNPDRLPSRQNWQVDEVSATFGVTLTTEAGVILSRAGTEATFEVTVTLRRK
ncbi:CU044_2847 family protein [Plantactinospora sonchi]|uniref:CU044_2847 family protein n=1 Tax=Plantactinospora sonchi TaxID=1544735 RepID=A0ABU7S3N6_9ACTN